MGGIRIIALSVFLACWGSFPAKSATGGRYFKSQKFEYVLEPGEFFRIDPETLVSEWGLSQGRFFWIPSNIPKWLQHRDFNEFSGTPSETDVGVQALTLGLGRMGALAETARIEFKILHRLPPAEPPPITSPVSYDNPLDLGFIPLGKAFSFDIKSRIRNPSHLSLSFQLRSGPAWLLLNSSGEILGSPRGAPGVFQASTFFTIAGQPRRTLSIIGTLY